MPRYIPKDALLAEIERRQGMLDLNNPLGRGGMVELEYFKNTLNTLEVKEVQEESTSERFAFKVIPRLLEMVEPTDRAKAYTAKLADTLETEGYSTDAKIVRESLKIMNGEKVPMATMDGESASEDLEEEIQKTIYSHFFDLNGIAIAGSSVYATVDDMVYIAKHFANWQKERMMKNYIDAEQMMKDAFNAEAIGRKKGNNK